MSHADRKSLFAEPGVAKRLTNEETRVLIAADEDRLFTNKHWRYEIHGEERPERNVRESLQRRGLIVYSDRLPRHWTTSQRGKLLLDAEIKERVAERKAGLRD